MLRTVAIGAGMALTLAVGIAVAGTPLGDGDDTGFVPPTKSVLKCEASVSKAAAKAGAAILVCHAKGAGAQLAQQPFDEEGCETTKGIGKFNAVATKVAALCPPCLNAASIIVNVESQLDHASNGLVFCDSTSGAHLGDGDDLGWVPKDKTMLKCEASLAKNIAKAALGLTICHIKSATLQFSQKPFDEEMCEASTLGKFSAKNGKLTGCPPCVQEILSSIQIPVEIVADNATGGTFCASPSGAFLN